MLSWMTLHDESVSSHAMSCCLESYNRRPRMFRHPWRRPSIPIGEEANSKESSVRPIPPSVSMPNGRQLWTSPCQPPEPENHGRANRHRARECKRFGTTLCSKRKARKREPEQTRKWLRIRCDGSPWGACMPSRTWAGASRFTVSRRGGEGGRRCRLRTGFLALVRFPIHVFALTARSDNGAVGNGALWKGCSRERRMAWLSSSSSAFPWF